MNRITKTALFLTGMVAGASQIGCGSNPAGPATDSTNVDTLTQVSVVDSHTAIVSGIDTLVLTETKDSVNSQPTVSIGDIPSYIREDAVLKIPVTAVDPDTVDYLKCWRNKALQRPTSIKEGTSVSQVYEVSFPTPGTNTIKIIAKDKTGRRTIIEKEIEVIPKYK